MTDERLNIFSQIKKPPEFLKTSDAGCAKSIVDLKVLIIHAEWNKLIIDNLVKGAISTLESMDVLPQNILIQSVPGSYELPWACNAVLENSQTCQQVDAIIAIGVLIKGDTMHFEYISEAVSQQLMQVSLKHNKPIIFGVLTCLNESQALIRSGLDNSSPSNHNHGPDWARAAVECALNAQRFRNPSVPFDKLFVTANGRPAS